MATNFCGSVDSEVTFREGNGDLESGRVDLNVRSQEEYQSAMLNFNEVNQEVQKIRMDLTNLMETFNQFCSNQGFASSNIPQKSSKKLPEGLSVRKHTVSIGVSF